MRPFIISLFCLTALTQGSIAKDYTLKDQSKGVIEQRTKSMKLRGKAGIIVASDSNRSESGDIAADLLKKAGFEVSEVITVKNLRVTDPLERMLNTKDIDLILCIGGTGISPHDVTIEAIEKWGDKEIPGYGEHFRFLTHERWKKHKKELGLLAIDTRVKAVVTKNKKIIFAVPGSPDATQLAVTELIIPGFPTLLGQLKKKED